MLPSSTAAAALLALAEQPFEDVADIARLAAEIELRAAGAESARARAATPAAEAEGGRGIAIGVDLAAVEARALVLVGEEIIRSEEHTSELQSLMRFSYAVFCLKKKNNTK